MKQVVMLAVAILTVSMLAFVGRPMVTADAHTGAPDVFCRFVDSQKYGYNILCSSEPVVGEVAVFLGGIHRTITYTETFEDGRKNIGFDCGHSADGTPIPACSPVIYLYEVVGNN